jgi:phage terminase large subunit
MSSTDEKTLRYIEDCHRAGMPRDQVELLYRSQYVAHPKQMMFHAAARQADEPDKPSLILFGGGRGGGKSYAAVAQAALDDCQRYSNLKVLFLRKLQRTARESFNDLVRKITSNIKCTLRSEKLSFPNGSFIVFDGLRTPRDIDKFVGVEYDLIIIEELTQLTEKDFNQLRGSLRTSRSDDWRPRMYLTTNPGNIGHEFVKKMFIEPYRNNAETTTKFIPSLAKDNPFLNPDYMLYLDSLEGDLRAMWRDGIWDLFEGIAFPTFDAEHIITYEEYLNWISTGSWIYYCGIDYGVTSPYCCLWQAFNPTMGRSIFYREDYQASCVISEQVARILSLTPYDENISVYYADPAMWGRQSTDTMITTVADIYRDNGLVLTKGDNQRINGKRKIDNMLCMAPDGAPKLLIVDKCTNLIRQMQSLQRDPKNPEDVMKCSDDHAYDAMRMALSSTRDVIIRDNNADKIKRYQSALLSYFPN